MKNILSFWDQDDGTVVSIEGTLSRFAPFIIGPHKLKRDEHQRFRAQIEELERQGITPGPSANAMLSFTAGQMVWRPELPGAKWKYLGLYQSIARNSIPLFVESEYFASVKDEIFGENRYGCDVKVIGQVKHLSEIAGEIEDIMDKQPRQGIRPGLSLWKGQRPLGIYVDKVGSIERIGPERYLDGDIWVAVSNGKEERFVSRFLDLSDGGDMATKIQELKDEVKALPASYKVTALFDEEIWERA